MLGLTQPKLTVQTAITTLSFIIFPEYKKKYGEEHGSCQAGIAGSFMEVGTVLYMNSSIVNVLIDHFLGGA